jgi:hypothetical protein
VLGSLITSGVIFAAPSSCAELLGAECVYVAHEQDGTIVGVAMVCRTRARSRRGRPSAPARLGPALRIAVLAANAPAPRFCGSLGGRVVGERVFDGISRRL